jgi:hypothetical protein
MIVYLTTAGWSLISGHLISFMFANKIKKLRNGNYIFITFFNKVSYHILFIYCLVISFLFTQLKIIYQNECGNIWVRMKKGK